MRKGISRFNYSTSCAICPDLSATIHRTTGHVSSKTKQPRLQPMRNLLRNQLNYVESRRRCGNQMPDHQWRDLPVGL